MTNEELRTYIEKCHNDGAQLRSFSLTRVGGDTEVSLSWVTAEAVIREEKTNLPHPKLSVKDHLMNLIACYV